MLPLGSALNYLLIDVPLALIALLVGVFSALWYVRHTASTLASSEESEEASREKEAKDNDSERANMAALQLRDLAKNVASDVGAHNTLVSDITDELGNSHSAEAVTEAVKKILSANETLQDRLADADQKIQSQAEEIRTQQSEARTDVLTKLANRRAFDDAIKKNLEIFSDNRWPFSLVIFDVDHFKKFNDTHGHQAGDEVLRAVGKQLKQVAKSTDIPCRYGGEEFALILPNSKIDSARITSESVRKAIEGHSIEFEGKTLNVTASIGVAEIAAGEDAVRLIRRSDDCVYAAKEAGRNQSYWHNGSECLAVGHGTKSEGTTDSDGANDTGDAKPKNLNSTEVGDTLASLPDSPKFSEELQRRIAESHRFGVSLSVMSIRVKDYADLENEYGNAVGRLLLDSVAQFIRSSLRGMDLLGKSSAGEFVVMLPGSTEREAKQVAARVQARVSNCVIPLGGRKLRLQVQQGVSDVYPDDDAASMIGRANQVIEPLQETAPAS